MTIAMHKPATYADLEAVPPNLAAEILSGTLVTHLRPLLGHGRATSALGAITTGSYQLGNGGPEGWEFIVEPELHLGPHVVVPDIAAWRRTRSPGPRSAAFTTVAPDWICESLSASTEKIDLGQKLAIYAQFGVNHLWVLDPRVKSLECFVLQNKEWVLKGTCFDNDKVSATPFDAMTFALDLLWPPDEPAPTNNQSAI
jgi:Uma2 family endonuclease